MEAQTVAKRGMNLVETMIGLSVGGEARWCQGKVGEVLWKGEVRKDHSRLGCLFTPFAFSSAYTFVYE